MTLIFDLIYLAALAAFIPLILYRGIHQGRYRRGWSHRFGFVPIRLGSKPCIWIHAVSMGEVNATASLVRLIEQKIDCDVVVSTTTDTGYDRAFKLYGSKHKVFFLPFDFSWSIRRALRRIRPSLVVLMELEVWRNLTHLSRQSGIPVMVANGRISSGKGFPRYKRVAKLVRPIFSQLTAVLAQDKQYADRFAYLGVPRDRIKVVSSLKYDTAQTQLPVSGQEELAQALHINASDRIWVAGSTGPGEEEAILETYLALVKDPDLTGLKLVIVPRKPERFDDVAQLLQSSGLKMVRYSQVKAGDCTTDGTESLILGDTMGDLRRFYAWADLIFVGRTLVPMGGSDMIEAAALAKPVVVGPHTENFSDSMARLLSGHGIVQLADRRELTDVVRMYLKDQAKARHLGHCGREVVLASQGATDRTLREIETLLK